MGAKSHLTDFTAPGGRRPPGELVRQLRELNPAAEVIYAGKGKWILGTVRHDKEARAKVARVLGAFQDLLSMAAPGAHAHVDPGSRPLELTAENRRELAYRLWKKRLQYQGFRIVTVFPEAMLDSSIVEAYRQARWLRRNREAFNEAEAAASSPVDDSKGQEELVLDAHRSEYRDIHRHAFRHRTGVLFDVNDYDARIGRNTARSA